MDVWVVYDYTGSQYRQVIEPPPVQRQRLHALLVHHARDRRILRLQQRHPGVHFHRLLNSSDLQREIDSRLLAQLNHNSRSPFSAESGGTELHHMLTGHQIPNLVRTVRGSRCRVRQPRRRLRYRHGGSGNGSSSWIQNCSQHHRIHRLRVRQRDAGKHR